VKRPKWDIDCLKRNSIPFQKDVKDTIKPGSGANVNERWTEFESTLLSSAQTEVGYQKRERARKPWIKKR
jgi:hypothetical protein